MTKICYILILLCLSYANSTAQEIDTNKTYLYLEVDELPVFGGDNNKVLSYIYKKLRWPKVFDGEGRVIISAVIDREGKVKSANIVKKLFEECDKQVKEIVENMPDWKPGKLNGQDVNVKIYIPIQFVLK